MATSFPTSLDSFTNPSASDALDSVSVPHADQHANINDAVEALQAKVGVDGSAVTSSLDYQVNGLPAGLLGSDSTTSDLTLSTSDTDIVNTFVTLSTSRVLKITGYIGQLDNPSTTLNVTMRLRSDVAGSGVQYEISLTSLSSSAPSTVGLVMYVATFAAGTYNFYLAASTSTGTARANGSASRRHYVLVEDVGAP